MRINVQETRLTFHEHDDDDDDDDDDNDDDDDDDVQGLIRSVKDLLTADSNTLPYQTDQSSLTHTH